MQCYRKGREKMNIKLEVRKCHCGKKFKVMSKSKQKHCSLDCKQESEVIVVMTGNKTIN